MLQNIAEYSEQLYLNRHIRLGSVFVVGTEYLLEISRNVPFVLYSSTTVS